jgi:hypothetical protein
MATDGAQYDALTEARCSHSQAREEAAAKAAEHRLARVTSSIELDRHSVQVSLVHGLLIAL